MVVKKQGWALVLLVSFCFMGLSAFAVQQEFLDDRFKKPAYRTAWQAMFKGEKNVAPWYAKMDKNYQSNAHRCNPSTIDGVEYEVHNLCKKHDCGDNHFIAFFAPEGRQAWGALITTKHGPNGDLVNSTERFFGKPVQNMKDALVKAKDCEAVMPK
jgi:hypothetical protein